MAKSRPRKNQSERSNLPQAYINNSFHLARKYARIFVGGTDTLEENCSLLGTDNVQGQISEHIFAPNRDYRVYYPSNLLRNARSFENWSIFSDIPRDNPQF